MSAAPKGFQKDAGAGFKAVLNKYKKAVEDFTLALEFSTSSYDLMIAKQEYLMAVSGVIKDISEICGYDNLSKAATFFESAASAYLDDSDRRAHNHSSDGRFALNEDISRFLKSRLDMRAYQAYRIWALYSKELQYSIDPSAFLLEFMLDIALELPIDAWDCAPCLAAGGNCKGCGYGRDHRICSHPGSTYEMLSWSSGYIIKGIREGLTETRVQSPNSRRRDSCSNEPKKLVIGQRDDSCEGFDAVDLCDMS